MSFQEKSYELHQCHYQKVYDEKLYQTWFNFDTIDAWRHHRMVSFLSPLLQTHKNSKWVTIGDGRFGLDSIMLKKIEASLHILPTDINSFLLEKAKEKKIISSYSIENAEKLSFNDNEFDFAFCKEAYHHFPRPFIALYEMLRVARIGVVLIEPVDHISLSIMEYSFSFLKNSIKKTINFPVHHSDKWRFEEAGNYVYTISKREMQKIALGIGLPLFAYKYFNDHYEKGGEYAKFSTHSKLFKKVKRKIAIANIKNKLGFSSPNMMIAILFKNKPNKEVLDSLKKCSFCIDYLPRNPYMKS